MSTKPNGKTNRKPTPAQEERAARAIEKVAGGNVGSQPRKPAPQPAPAEEEARKAQERLRFLKRALPDLNAAETELRKHAAEWVAVIRNRITALAQEVNAVMNAAKPGTVLGRVLSDGDLSSVYVDLQHADNEACSLTVLGEDLPIPNLLGMRNYICEKLFPLAAAGAKEFAKPEEAKS